jgi:hypothetical protein
MLDMAGIVFSSVMMVLAIVRAVQLDRTLPWFQKITRNANVAAATRRPWQRHD